MPRCVSFLVRLILTVLLVAFVYVPSLFQGLGAATANKAFSAGFGGGVSPLNALPRFLYLLSKTWFVRTLGQMSGTEPSTEVSSEP